MNDQKPGAEFAKALLAQDPVLNTTDFAQLRARVLERVARAQRRERLARRIALSFGGITLFWLAFVVAIRTGAIAHPNWWPDWVEDGSEILFLLLPVTALLLGAIYVLRHHRELHNSRFEAQNHTLVHLQSELAEVKRLLLEQAPGAGLPPQAGSSLEITPSGTPPANGTPATDRSQRSQEGFTLMELLVSLAILSLLAALIMPGIAAVKVRVKRTVCQNNLGQLGRALALYLSEFHAYPGTLPNPVVVPAGAETKTPDPVATHSWDERLLPYLGRSKGVMRCPSHALSPRELAWGADYRNNYNYGYNALGCDRLQLLAKGPGMNLTVPSSNLGLGCLVLQAAEPGVGITTSMYSVSDTKVAVPAEMIAIADRQGGGEWNSAVVGPGNPESGRGDDPGDQHLGGANAIFCDSHVEYGLQQRWKEASEQARCRWNNDHQAHREVW
jgi:prepilin-type N-terminal cleavage/methylation domain-containing protein/prepilin-type processing-associated H-X9-DG protein